MHTPKSKDWTEPAIYISVLQSLAKQTQDNLQAVCRLIKKTSKASKEEEHANLELNNCETEYKDSQETLAHRIADLNQVYIALVDLELDHDKIRKEGNIIDYEKKREVPNTNTLYQERVNNLRDKLESCRITLRDICKVVQPTPKGISQLQ